MSTSSRAPDPNVPTTPGRVYRRPSLVTVFSILRFIAAAITLLFSGLVFYLAGTEADIYSILLIGFSSLYLMLGVMSLVAGIGLWRLKTYGRTLQVVLAWIDVLAVPIGTIVSGLFVLRYFDKPGAQILFSEKPAAELESEDLAQVNELPQPFAADILLLVLVLPLVAVLFNGIVAAIALPGLLRARVSANEAAAIVDLKRTVSGELAYAELNDRYFDTPECLMSPAECIPGYPHDGPVFLSEQVFRLKLGYQREFHPGPPAGERDIGSANLSPSSIQSFALVAYPSKHGLTGVRSFCFDSVGNVCLTTDGSIPHVSSGRCYSDCRETE